MTAGRAARLASVVATTGVLVLLLPGPALAHALNPTYTSRLPLAVYVAGAAATVALSFIFVLVRDVRADRLAPAGPLQAWRHCAAFRGRSDRRRIGREGL